MEVRISIVIQSMLSDAIHEYSMSDDASNRFTPDVYRGKAQERIRFVKYLVHMFPDTNKSINVDTVYNQFKLGDK